MSGIIFRIISYLILLFTGIIGALLEKRHIKSILIREQQLQNILIISKKDLNEFQSSGLLLLSSGVVFGIDNFRKYIFKYINFFGGRVVMYESVMNRVRREAILRIKKQAQDYGFNCIVDLRIETATITSNNKKQDGGKVEIIAYGTGTNISKIMEMGINHPKINYNITQEDNFVSSGKYLLGFILFLIFCMYFIIYIFYI